MKHVLAGLMMVVLVEAVAGCVVRQPQQVTTSVQFDASEAERLMVSGKNVIDGSGMLKTRGGDVKTCAGEYVLLFLCDPQGHFKFENLADGNFYVMTRVVWEAPGHVYQGGEIIQKVSLSGGETKNVVIAH